MLKSYNAFYLNLRNFGLVNKKYGKQEADNIIVRYSEYLLTLIGEDECAGRLSGDAFILTVHKEKTDDVLKLTSGVNIRATLDGREEMTILQAVAGCYDIDDNEMDSEGILGRCSTALNAARHDKHIPYLFSTPEMHGKAIYQKQILAVFADALENGEFKPYYQPKVNTESKTLAGAEALVRWIRDGRTISPGEFIPVLETDDSICVLDFYIFEQVCRDHIEQIKTKLGISGVMADVSTWQKAGTENEKGLQIDLVIDRRDHVINLCEIKYVSQPYTITKEYDMSLKNKVAVFRESTKTNKTLQLTLITTYGLKNVKYSGYIGNNLCMDDLFS